MSQILVTGEAKIRDIQGPVVSNSGVITALDGDASQYVRGDGTLADFPTSTGGGSSVSYYLNSSVSQGTIGGVAYRQLSKTPISGAGTDIAISSNGYVASYITDANDPALLEVPAGNFNCEFYFSVNSNAHNPYVYAELYKYDGTTFTLLGSNVAIPEYLTNGTTLSAYYFAIPVAVAALTITDRLAIRIYVNVDGRVVTLHTENNHLCQVVTTFSKGLISLNNLTRQNQFFATGTSGTDFNIASATATHTFNLPVASATNTGKLSSTDWSTFNGKVPYTGANASVNLGVYDLIASGIYGTFIEASVNGLASSPLVLRTGTTGFSSGTDAVSLISSPTSAHTLSIISNIAIPNVTKRANIGLDLLSATRTFTFPDASGTLALTSNLSSYVPYTGATTSVDLGTNTLSAGNTKINDTLYLKLATTYAHISGYYGISVGTNIFVINNSASTQAVFSLASLTTSRTFTLPDANGTLALTSNLSAYLPLTGGTLTGALSGTSATFSSSVEAVGYRATSSSAFGGTGVGTEIGFSGGLGYIQAYNRGTSTYQNIKVDGATVSLQISGVEKLGIASTGAATFSSSVTSTIANGYFLSAVSATTSEIYARIGNTSGFLSVGCESSTGGVIAVGTSAYAAIISQFYNNSIQFATNNTVRATITGSGNFGIGITTPQNILHLYATSYPFIQFTNSSTGSTGGDGFRIGYEGSEYALIDVRENAPLVFQTNATERMRITSGGDVGIGMSGVDLSRLTTRGKDSTSTNYAFIAQNSATTNLFLVRNDNVVIVGSLGTGTVYSNGGVLTNTNPSDKNLKENISDIPFGLNEILQLRPVSYDWKNNVANQSTQYGFIAQEVQKVLPQLVTQFDSYEDEKREFPIKRLGLDKDAIFVSLVKAIQEQTQIIKDLEARIKQLENK